MKDQIAEELRRYDEHLRDVRGLSDGTRSDRLRIIGRLLRQRFAARPLDIARLLPAQVRRFLARQLGAHPSRSMRLRLALNPQRKLLRPVADGVGFLGYIVRPHYRLARRAQRGAGVAAPYSCNGIHNSGCGCAL